MEKMSRNKNNIFLIVFFVSTLVFGILIGKHTQDKNLHDYINSIKLIRNQNSEDSLIQPLIGTVSSSATDIGMFVDIKQDISDYLLEEQKTGRLSDFSFYFKELNSPLWFGINNDLGFAPGSLFKLPIAISAYKQSESDSSFLQQRLTYTEQMNQNNKLYPDYDQSTLIVGKDYSIEDLINIMIEKSDNGAKDLLLTALNKEYIADFFKVIDIENILVKPNYEISSTEYSLFLRILYNSSYINEQNSQKLLNLLTKSSFTQGLQAGVPSSVRVAHKFGLYKLESHIILNDCGIIYHEQDPFIVCFMTKGKDYEPLVKVISHVTEMVYKYQDQSRK